MGKDQQNLKNPYNTDSSRSSPQTPTRNFNSNETLRPSPGATHGVIYGATPPLRKSEQRLSPLVDGYKAYGSRRQGSDSTTRTMSQTSQSSDEYVAENARLKERIENKEEKIRELEFKLACEQDKSASVLKDVEELQRKVAELQIENAQLSSSQDSTTGIISNLQESLEKANKTIQVQSNQIRNPRDGRTYGSFTNSDSRQPLRISTSFAGNNSHNAPAGELIPYRTRASDGPRTPTHNRFSQENTMASGRTNSRQRNPYVGPVSSERPAFPVGQTSEFPRVSRRPPDSTTSSFETVIHQAPRAPTMPPANIGGSLSRLFTTTIEWCKKFTNNPRSGAGQPVPRHIWIELGQDRNNAFVAGLLADPQTRYLAIAKVVICRLVGFALYKRLVRHFKPEFDERLNKASLHVHGSMRAPDRRASFEATSLAVADLAKDPDWKPFFQDKMHKEITQLWNIILPLLDHSVNPAQAWEHLNNIFEEGVKAGLQMLQTFAVFTIDFPPVGNSSLFNPTTMSNIDPYFTEDTTTLGLMGVKLRLAVSPVIYQQSFEDLSVRNDPQVILFSKVLLMNGSGRIGV